MSVPQTLPSGASTTWEWRKVKLRSTPTRAGESPSSEGPSRFRVSRRFRKWTQIEIQYRGGPESSWVLRHRGVTRRFPGWMALEDVLTFDSWKAR